ncbi:hypothetical protein [Achromobacter denitrificans]|uniref:hypothetical protein n=1 Tax=Achromobacter denitrificans TaxID=32002 RepID=UPI001466E7DB|nr:hypothetical protein [Achromobacter denitrificans]CAB3812125.1 hypothetical protein LMG1860_00432 [Achromobacter denitrificans]
MQSDRELLELAAKAAGYELHWRGLNGVLPAIGSRQDQKWWNPLTDDGDAFRLSAKLGLEIRRGKWPSGTRYVSAHRVWNSNDSCYEDDGIAVDPAPYAATRLAIVRAAASLAARPKRHNDGADRE